MTPGNQPFDAQFGPDQDGQPGPYGGQPGQASFGPSPQDMVGDLPSGDDVPGLMIKQKITPITNKYWVHAVDTSGNPGPVIAFAEQKKFKLKEEVLFFADEAKSRVLFSFKSRQVIDLAATTDVLDHTGRPIATFRKDAMASMLNSTWHLEGPGYAATGQERNKTVAVARRFAGFLPFVGDLLEAVPWQFHFDFYDVSGQLVMSDERQLKLRDQYLITLPPAVYGRPLDWRVAAALGVALDAFQGR